jgi:hypothetical protein
MVIRSLQASISVAIAETATETATSCVICGFGFDFLNSAEFQIVISASRPTLLQQQQQLLLMM